MMMFFHVSTDGQNNVTGNVQNKLYHRKTGP